MRTFRIILTLAAAAAGVHGQLNPIDEYMQRPDVKALVDKKTDTRTLADFQNAMPASLSTSFANYAAARLSLGSLRQSVENLRLNKLVATAPGQGGVTALVSHVSTPSVLGFATEYGAILQTNQGNVSTVRGNFLGISRMIAGAEVFPYCAEIDQQNCEPASRWLRRFSGALSFTSTRDATAPATQPTTAALFGDDYRMASWGLRFDLTANDPNDPKFIKGWRGAIGKLRSAPQSGAYTEAIVKLFTPHIKTELYQTWEAETLTVLKDATGAAFREALQVQLDKLIDKMKAADPEFETRVLLLRRTFMNYAMVRDELIRDVQVHRASLEYTNQHPQAQPTTSNLRFIYSHQPTRAPLLVTANFAATWYNREHGSTGRFRDLQIAAQLDRRLGQIANLGNAIATFGLYYQWMKEDALIEIGPGNVAPGTGIVLPGAAATLLGTKGHIAIAQGKLTIPVNGTIRVPISVTWSRRRELIKEEELRGQVGLTLDLDSIFRR